MKVVVIYRPDSEYARIVETFIHEYQIRHDDKKLEVLNVDSREGSATASLYDIMQQPAILALRLYIVIFSLKCILFKEVSGYQP
jgi:hypothetical protein